MADDEKIQTKICNGIRGYWQIHGTESLNMSRQSKDRRNWFVFEAYLVSTMASLYVDVGASNWGKM